MNTQSFSNHVRIHPIYHYFAVPVSLALVPASIINLILNLSLTSIILVVGAILIHLALFLARDYAKKNQDRIIRAELRLRYYILTGQRLDSIEDGYATGQLLAMRFANDKELIDFINNPETQRMTPEQIKRSIIQWKPDLMRV